MTAFDDLRASHRKGYESTSEEVRGSNPICLADDHAWPCDTVLALDLVVEARAVAEEMRGDVHHHLNPAIGWLRLDFHNATGSDPLEVNDDDAGLPSTVGLPDTITFRTRTIVSALRHMQSATAAADAALGQESLRDQIAHFQAGAAAARQARQDQP